MHEIVTTVHITAPAERLWELLTDLSLFCQWNPLFVKGTGELKTGERLQITVRLPAIGEFQLEPKVLRVMPFQELSWKHCYLSKALVSWQHSFRLETLPGGQIRLTQRAKFGGLLALLWVFTLGTQVRLGCEEMNRALKRWGEKTVRCLKC